MNLLFLASSENVRGAGLGLLVLLPGLESFVRPLAGISSSFRVGLIRPIWDPGILHGLCVRGRAAAELESAKKN